MKKNHFARLLALCLFGLFFLWGWRIYNVFRIIPAHPDVLEVLWGIEWYHKALLEKNVLPFSLHIIFHPLEWQSSTLAHTPFLFVLALPLFEVGGAAFAYNALTILAILIAFCGAFLFIKRFAPHFIAACAALVFTFGGINWASVGSRLPILCASSFLPWLALTIELLKQSEAKRLKILGGVFWGLMINFSLYGSFIGGMAFALLGGRLFRLRWVKNVLIIASIALLTSSPVTLAYWLGMHRTSVHYYGIEHNLYWGASLNSLFIPSFSHPLPQMQKLASSIYKGPRDESGMANLGIITWLLAFISVIWALKSKANCWELVFLTACGVILSMGLLLKWDSEPVKSPIFHPLLKLIWAIGYALKPGVFRSPNPLPSFDGGIPLPGLLLMAIVPFWEVARTVSRYAAVGSLGLVTLGSIALKHLPKFVRYLLLIVWLIETLPHPINGVRTPYELHPAYKWLAEKELPPGEGIVDMVYPSVLIGPEVLWAAWLHGKPTASGTGSYWLEHSYKLWAYFIQNDLSNPDVWLILRQYRIRYLFLHMRGEGERKMWELITHNPSFRPVRCFDSGGVSYPWGYEICVAEVMELDDPMNVIREEGWSGKEAWGIWAEGHKSRVTWLATSRQNHLLHIEAFPLCMPGENQEMRVKVNGHQLFEHLWEDCELWEGKITIPSSLVKEGINEIVLEFKYAMSPAEITHGQNPDPRKLAAGFTKLRVEPAD